MSTFSHALDVSQLQSALSAPRLASYQALIGTGLVDGEVGAYVWGLELNAALVPILSMVEVVLRNRIHEAATAQFGKPEWYQDVLKNNGDKLWQAKVVAEPTVVQNYYRKGVPPYNKKSIWISGQKKNLRHWRSPAEAKLDEVISRLSSDGKPVTPDQVVAHAMFGFWLALLGPTFESPADPLALWPQCTAAAFPSSPTMSRSSAFALLDSIKKLRNRISHHEPAWRIASPLTPSGVHTALGIRIQEMRTLLEAMAPDVCGLLDNMGTFERLRWLLDPQTIPMFAGQTSKTAVDVRALTRKIKKLAAITHRSLMATPAPLPTKVVHVRQAGRTILTMLPHG